MRSTCRLGVAILGVIGAAGALAGCGNGSPSWTPPTAVKITTDGEVASLFPSWGSWMTDGPADNTQALLLRDGDYILGQETPFRYQVSDGKAITLTREDWNGQLGNAIVTLEVDRGEARDWISKATPSQLGAVRTVSVSKDVDSSTLLALKPLAAANPNVDLMVGTDGAMQQALPLFHPRAVFASRLTNAEVLKVLGTQTQLETLLFEASEPGSLTMLSTLSQLKRLMLSKWDAAKTGPLPSGLSSLKAVSVTESDLKDLTPLAAAASTIDEVAVFGGITTLSGLDKLTHLRTLVLTGNDRLTDLSALGGATQLRWLGLPASTTQEQFAAVVREHPDLEILELIGAAHITDLSPLASLKHLNGLVLGGPYDKFEAIKGLTSLRFLGVPAKTWEAAPAQVAELKKALPDALVVRVKPFCLGSGWILLLAPVFALGWIRKR